MKEICPHFKVRLTLSLYDLQARQGGEERLAKIWADDGFYPESIGNVVRHVATQLPIPILITENGVSTDDDTRRVEYIRRAVNGVNKSREVVATVSFLFYDDIMHKIENNNKVNKILHSHGILYRVLLPYAAYTILVLVFFFALTEMLVVRQMKKEIQDSVYRTLEQAYNTSDILLEQNFSYFFNLYYAPQMRRYLNAETMEPNEYTEVIDYLLDCAGRDMITHSVCLYNEQLGIIFSSNEGAFPIKQFYDQEMIECIVKNQGKNKLYPREMHWKIGSARKTSNVISYVFYDESLADGKRMALIVNVDQEKYQNFIGKNLEKSYVITEVIDAQGHLVSGNAAGIGERLTDGYVYRIVNSGKEKDSFDFRADDKNCYISWQNSSVFGWTYVGIADYNELFSEFNKYNSVIIFSSFCFIMIGLLFSIRFTRRIYIPMKELLSNMDLNGLENDGYQDEYELLNSAVKKLSANTNEMEVKKHRYNQAKRNEIMSRLLYGGNWPEIDIKEMKEVGLMLEGPVFSVVRFSFNHYDSLKRVYSQNDLGLFCFSVINVLEEYLGSRGYRAYGMEDGDQSVCLILQLDREYEKEEDYCLDDIPFRNITGIQKVLEAARAELEKVLNPITLSVSVGRSIRQYEQLNRSWLDTKYAMTYTFIRGTRLVVLFTSHMESYESRIPYPVEVEKKLLAGVKGTKESGIMSGVEEFFHAIEKMAPVEMKWSINQLTFSLFHIGITYNYTTKDGSPLDWKNWTNRMNAADTKEEMKNVLIQLLTNMTGRVEDSDAAKSRLAQKVRQYIDEHFQEEKLSVTEAASQVGFSTNYVRVLFKNEFGESVSDYIQRKRIEEAKNLLRSTDFTGKKIAGMVGYSDNRYFYVVFKRITGETAESYRQREGLLSKSLEQVEK